GRTTFNCPSSAAGRLRLSPLSQHAVQATRSAYSHEQSGPAQGRNRRVRRAKLRPTVGRVPIVLERRLQHLRQGRQEGRRRRPPARAPKTDGRKKSNVSAIEK